MHTKTKDALDFIPEVSGFNQSGDLNYFCIFRFFLASTLDRDTAVELTRRCFVKARRPARNLGSHIHPKLWLMKTAVNLVHGYFRRQRFLLRQRPQVNDVKLAELCKWVSRAQGTVEETRLAQCQVQVIWRILCQLPLLQRTIFILRYIEELDFIEIAESMGIKQREVKKGLDDVLALVRTQVYSIGD
jgi:RNA polymerase sigma-70 factor (ECF subfamily)